MVVQLPLSVSDTVSYCVASSLNLHNEMLFLMRAGVDR